LLPLLLQLSPPPLPAPLSLLPLLLPPLPLPLPLLLPLLFPLPPLPLLLLLLQERSLVVHAWYMPLVTSLKWPLPLMEDPMKKTAQS
jgi:hypothetical protein